MQKLRFEGEKEGKEIKGRTSLFLIEPDCRTQYKSYFYGAFNKGILMLLFYVFSLIFEFLFSHPEVFS